MRLSLLFLLFLAVNLIQGKNITTPPVVVNDNFSTIANTVITGNIANNDSNLENPVYQLVSFPGSGTLTLESNGEFNYTPLPDFCGSGSFIYQVCNNGLSNCCAQAVVSIEISEANCFEICNDNLDNDSDGLTDGADDDCSCIPYSVILENNCCKTCSSGNLEVKTAFWQPNYINLSATNLALNKPSAINGFAGLSRNIAKNANDGHFASNINTNFDYAFSPNGFNNYWDIDLVGFYNIEQINVFTKEGCCQGNATNYRVFISENPFYDTDFQMLLDQNGVQNFTIPLIINGNIATLNNVNTTGRFVRVFLEGTGQLQLVEVEIIGNGTTNSSPYHYDWNDPNIGNTANPDCLPPGNYTVTITDISTGCMSTEFIDVEN